MEGAKKMLSSRTNPALAEIRKHVLDGGVKNAPVIFRIRAKSLEWALNDHETGWMRFTRETESYIRHAIKVLNRLSRIIDIELKKG